MRTRYAARLVTRLSPVLVLVVLALGGAGNGGRTAGTPAAAADLAPSPTLSPATWDIRVSDYHHIPRGVHNSAIAVTGHDVYAVYIAYNAAGSDTIYFARSGDGGHTYRVTPLYECSQCSLDGGNLARPQGAPAADPNVYLAFQVDRHLYLYHSTDRGATWAVHLARDTEPQGNCMLNPLVVVDGAAQAIVLVWGETTPQCDVGYYYAMHSTDDGATWTAPVQVSDLPTGWGGPRQEGLALYEGALYFVWLKQSTPPPTPPYNIPGIYFRRSADWGATWSPPAQVDNRLLRGPATVALAVGPGGAVYVVYSDDYLADMTGRSGLPGVGSDWRTLTFLTRSTDDGVTWTYPARVDDCPECDATPGISSVSSGVAVDEATGDVYVAFVDKRNQCGDPIAWNSDLFMRRSTDGGRSWGPSAQISDPIPDNSLSYQINVLIANRNVYTLSDRSWFPYLGIFLDIQPAGVLPPGPTTPPTAAPTGTATPTATAAPTPVPPRRVFLPRVVVAHPRQGVGRISPHGLFPGGDTVRVSRPDPGPTARCPELLL
jgi:hypothetical protein